MARVKVVIPLDGSGLAEHSLAYIDAIKRLGEPQLVLVSVVDTLDEIPGGARQEAVERNLNVLQTYLRGMSAELQARFGVTVETRLVEGNPATMVLATMSDADLLIISTHGRSGIRRWRLGSVADKIIRGATCDTLVVSAHSSGAPWSAEQIPSFGTILVPLDGSTLAEQALPTALRYAAAYGSKLHLVRVADYPIAGAEGVGQAWQLITESCRAYLDQKIVDLAPVVPQTAVLLGSAADSLLTYAEEQHIALIVLTSHGRGGLARATLGSVSDRLLGGPAPVLIVHSDQQA